MPGACGVAGVLAAISVEATGPGPVSVSKEIVPQGTLSVLEIAQRASIAMRLTKVNTTIFSQ